MEGKKRYVAIVLFLLIGLTLFTFANPVEEQKGSKGNGSKDTEVTDKDTTDGTLGTGESQTQVQPQVQNQVADTSYADALAAVVKAEGSLAELDVDTARDLINKVTNQNQKNELTERLDIVEEAIDAIELVETLEQMVEEATDRDGIEDSIDYRTDKEIIQIVDALRNEDVQESLKDRLQILSRILDDTTAPEYDGVEDNEITNKDISLTYSDTDEETGTKNEVTVTVTLDGEEIDYTETFTKEGTYVVTLRDEAFNETTVTFTIDKTAAKKNAVNANVQGYKNEVKVQYATNGNKVVAYISINEELKENPTFTFFANGKEIAVINDAVVKSASSNENYPYVYTATLEINEELDAEDGIITFNVTDIVDEAGNKTEDITKMTTGKTITLDRTAAKVNYVAILSKGENHNYAKNGDTIRFLVSFNEEIQIPENYKDGSFVVEINGKKVNFMRSKGAGYEYIAEYKIPADEANLAEGELTFTISGYKDVVGNVGETLTKATHKTYNKVIYDRTAPKPHSTTYSPKTPTNGNVTVTIKVNEELKPVEGWTLSEDKKSISKEFTENTKGSVVISDLAGNTKTRYYKISNIDREAPKPHSTTYSPNTLTNGDVTVTIRVNEELKPVEGWTLSEDKKAISKVFTKNTQGSVVISDLAGNTVTRYYKISNIDKEAPKPHSTTYSPNTLTNGDVTVTIRVNEELKPVEGWTLSADKKAISKVFTENAQGSVVISDLAGNTKTRYYKVSNIDKVAATNKSADFYVSGLTQVGKTFYTQYGNKVVVNITTNEELGSNPTFTLHNNGNNYNVEDVIYRGLNDKGYHLYQASFEVTEETGMTDGEITFTVSNIIDKAGNVTADVTEASNGRKVILDNEAPLVDKLALVGANGEWNKDKTEYKQYAKVGTTIYVNARFKEELAATPVVTLNDKVTLTKATKQQSGNIWIYSYSYKVTENDGLVDGPLQVKVTNCKDYAGNSVELTNANATLPSQKIIIIDKTAPTYALYKEGLRPVQNVEVVEHNGKLYFNDNAEIQFHDNYRLSTMIVNDGKPYTTTVGVTGQIQYVREDGEYKYTVKDRAGNATIITVVRDTVVPEVTEHSYIGEDSAYRGMSFKLFDNSAVDKFVLNGTEYDRSNNNWSDANYDNISSSLKDGENTLVLYDIAGNATEHKFTLDRKGPEIIVKPSSVGINNIYSQLDLKLFDENEVSYAIVNGEEVIRKGTWVDIDDGHAWHAKHGENTIVAVDKAGNTTTRTFNVTKFNLVVENGVANLNEDAMLIDKPFYNDIDAENEVTINGNGKTVTQYITSVDKMYWVGNHTTPNGANIPVLANVFSTLTGKKFTINNLTLTGTMNSVMFGNYENADSNWFNTELNNVNIINTKVVSLSQYIAPAAVVYGNATFNNVNIYGTTRSELENAPDDPYWTIYDLAAVNSSNTTINGGKIGSIYLWAKAVMTINSAEIDTIDTKTTTGHLEIGNGTIVNRINMLGTNSYNPDVTIKAGATVKTLDLTKVTNLTDIVIEDGATVETILTAEGEMTLEAWKTANNK